MVRLTARVGMGIGTALALLVIAAIALGTAFDRAPDSIMARNFCALPCAFGVTPGITDRETAALTFGAQAIRNPTFSTARQYNYALGIDSPPDLTAAVNVIAASRSVANSTAARAGRDLAINETVQSILYFDQIEDGLVESIRLYPSRDEQHLWRVGDLLRAHGAPDSVAAAYAPIDPDPTDADPTEICDPDRPQIPPRQQIILIYGESILAQVSVPGDFTPDLEIARIAVTANFDVTLTSLLAGEFPCHARTAWQGFAPYNAYMRRDS